MGFNYGREKRKFDQEWERLQAEYEAAGMDEASIQEMKQYDWKWFCSQRVYNYRARPLPSECFQEAAGPSAPLYKCDSFHTDGGFQGRYGWILDVEDEGLSQRLQKLAPEDLELLTLLLIDGYRQADVARMLGCSRSAVSQRLKKIKKYLKGA